MKRIWYGLFFAIPTAGILCFGWYKHRNKPFMHHDKSAQGTILQAQKYVEDALQLTAEFFPEESVFKVSIPRPEPNLMIDDIHIDPFMGATTWVGFQKGIKPGVEIMAMGDWALFKDELYPVMNAALQHDIKITALHHHFLGETPHLYFMHIEVEGSLHHVAAGIKAMKDAVEHHDLMPVLPSPQLNDIDVSAVEAIIPVKAVSKNGMCKMVIGRTVRASCGCPVGKNMGINSWIVFAGTQDNAVVDGDFALFEDEVQPVIKLLQGSGIQVVSVHNHMIHEQPRLIYVHFWARGEASKIAVGLKHAIDATTMLTTGAKREPARTVTPCRGCGKIVEK